jgi:hypothetical protein
MRIQNTEVQGTRVCALRYVLQRPNPVTKLLTSESYLRVLY